MIVAEHPSIAEFMDGLHERDINDYPNVPEYVVYKGEDMICMGTVAECAAHMNVQIETIQFYLTPTYRKRLDNRRNARNYITVTRLDQ